MVLSGSDYFPEESLQGGCSIGSRGDCGMAAPRDFVAFFASSVFSY